MMGPRAAVCRMLCTAQKEDSWSDAVLNSWFEENPDYSNQEKKFITALFYGCVERKITLDYIIKKYSKIRLKKLDIEVLNILREGIYQLKFMDSVPDMAATDESVKLTRFFHRSNAAGYVNGILRQFIRDGKEITYPDKKFYAMEVKYSCPENLIKKLCTEYGREKAEAFLEDSLKKTPVAIRQNILFSQKKFESSLDGADFESVADVPYCYKISGKKVTDLDGFKKGYFHVQDVASQLCCLALGEDENDKIILDVCAAPGGKSFTIAQNTNAVVISNDLYKKRVEMIESGAKRLHIENIKTVVSDASNLGDDIPMADRILCDVPCSGYGVIRKKPEIKYKDPEEMKGLPKIQYKILCSAANKLKHGGTLVYSTCTLSKAENEGVVEKFLAQHPDFEAQYPLTQFEETKNMKFVTLFPQYFGSDGFFISKLVKK